MARACPYNVALPFLYPGSPRGESPYANAPLLHSPHHAPLPRSGDPLAPCLDTLFFRPCPPWAWICGPHGPTLGIDFAPSRFLLYKHWGMKIHQHSSFSHVQDGRHSPHSLCSSIPLGRFFFSFKMPRPICRTPSYMASDFLKPEYWLSPTPGIDPDQPSTSLTDRGTPTGRPSTRRHRTHRDWQVSPEKDTDWAMS